MHFLQLLVVAAEVGVGVENERCVDEDAQERHRTKHRAEVQEHPDQEDNFYDRGEHLVQRLHRQSRQRMLAAADDALLDARVLADVLPDRKTEHFLQSGATHMPGDGEINSLDLVPFPEVHDRNLKERHYQRCRHEQVDLTDRPLVNEVVDHLALQVRRREVHCLSARDESEYSQHGPAIGPVNLDDPLHELLHLRTSFWVCWVSCYRLEKDGLCLLSLYHKVRVNAS